MLSTRFDQFKPEEIAPNIHWVGYAEEWAGLHCNPYLIDDGEDVILIEPGSVPHFSNVARMVSEVVNPARINYILVSHQDPDLCASIPKFEEFVSPDLQIITHSRAAVLLPHYGIKAPYFNIDANNWQLTLKSGRVLKFVFTPYMHFPGSFMTYDTKSKILFSGDVFGGLSFDWSLYANEYYPEAMKAFHENYMPSRTILENAMNKLRELDISMIAPQHGSIINKDIDKYIDILANLECGDYLLVD
mgnify:FL=1